jgi:hypothetical protein
MVSAVAPGAVVNTDLLPRHLPFLPGERGDESLKPPPAVHGAGGSSSKWRVRRDSNSWPQIRPFRGQDRSPGELPLLWIVLKKYSLGDEQNFLGALMCLASDDVRDHIVSHKNDHGPSYRRYGALLR